MNGSGTGDNGRNASRIRSALAPTVRTESRGLRARRPKHRSIFDSHFAPAIGQKAAPAKAIRLTPASTIRNDAPPCILAITGASGRPFRRTVGQGGSPDPTTRAGNREKEIGGPRWAQWKTDARHGRPSSNHRGGNELAPAPYRRYT